MTPFPKFPVKRLPKESDYARRKRVGAALHDTKMAVSMIMENRNLSVTEFLDVVTQVLDKWPGLRKASE